MQEMTVDLYSSSKRRKSYYLTLIDKAQRSLLQFYDIKQIGLPDVDKKLFAKSTLWGL